VSPLLILQFAVNMERLSIDNNNWTQTNEVKKDVATQTDPEVFVVYTITPKRFMTKFQLDKLAKKRKLT